MVVLEPIPITLWLARPRRERIEKGVLPPIVLRVVGAEWLDGKWDGWWYRPEEEHPDISRKPRNKLLGQASSASGKGAEKCHLIPEIRD